MAAVVLGVAGGTCAGKTTVAEAILDAVGRDRIAFLPHSCYYHDVEWRDQADLLRYNFDHPSAADLELLVEHLRELKAGRPVARPVYDFVRHRRTERTQPVEPRPVILVEGILVLAHAELRQLLDVKVFVDTDADARLIRRIRRDMAERGRQLEEVLRQFEDTVRPMHLEYVEPSKRWADVIIPGGGSNRVAVAMVVARVNELLAEP